MRKLFLEYIKMVRPSDIKGLASASFMNYHTYGLHYICLHRDSAITLKVYYIPERLNQNGGFLVHPHNHRYPFHTVVLSGVLEHHLFDEKADARPTNELCSFSYKTKEFEPRHEICLAPKTTVTYGVDGEYFVGVNEVHTLRIIKPTILGIVQGPDTNADARIYLPLGSNSPECKTVEPMSEIDYAYILGRVRQQLFKEEE